MPYKKSLARKNFLHETDSILQTSRKSSYKKAGISDPAIDMILQAAVFKTSAQLEEYLKNAITDWLFNVKNNGYSANDLPDNLKWYFICNSHLTEYRQYIYNSDEKKLIDNLKSKQQNLLFDKTQSLADIINPLAVVSDRKYPSVRNIKRLFNRIGIPNVFHQVNRRSHRPFETILQSFLDIREAIAHQHPPNLTYDDVRDHTRSIQSFVSVMDRILHSHVISFHDGRCWRTS